MMMNRNNSLKLTGFLTGLVALSLFTIWSGNLLIFLVIALLAAFTLIIRHNRNIEKKDIIIAAVLGFLVMLTQVFLSVIVFMCYISSMSVIKGNDSIHFYSKSLDGERKRTMFAVVVIGGVLSILNIYLAQSNYAITPSFKGEYLLNAIQAGIFEEIVFRTFLYALCIEFTNQETFVKYQSLLVYLIMIVPHVLLHFNGGVDLISFVLLSLIFGLPFAYMQRRINILSAIGSHILIDTIRYIVFGL